MYDNIIKIYELEHIRNKIEEIDTKVDQNEILLFIKLKKDYIKCNYCLSDNIVINDYVKTKITHSISVTKKIYIIHKKRRYRCKHCLKTFYEYNPFTDHKHRLSKLTIMNILYYLKDPNHSFKSASIMFNTTSNTVISIFDYYVRPKRIKLPEVLCIYRCI